jgi:hypothetical protein
LEGNPLVFGIDKIDKTPPFSPETQLRLCHKVITYEGKVIKTDEYLEYKTDIYGLGDYWRRIPVHNEHVDIKDPEDFKYYGIKKENI